MNDLKDRLNNPVKIGDKVLHLRASRSSAYVNIRYVESIVDDHRIRVSDTKGSPNTTIIYARNCIMANDIDTRNYH